MASWMTARLRELGRVVTGATPKSEEADSWGDEIDFITPSDQGSGMREVAAARRLSNLGVQRLHRRIIPPGSTCFTCIGATIGKTSLVTRQAVTNQQINTVVPYDQTDAEFLYYALTFNAPMIAQIASGSATPIVNKTHFEEFRFRVPDLAEQKLIGRVLGALDDKIAVNGHIADTARKLASARYVSSTQHADRTVVLREIIDLCYGKALLETNREPGNIPVFGSNGRSGWHSTPLCSGPGIIVGRKGANAGSISWSQTPFWAIDTAFYVLPRSEEISLEYLYFLLDRAGFRNLVGDSAIPGLNREIALACRAQLPPGEIIRQATSEIRSLLELQSQASAESSSLAKLRDALLPRLMSGEIRVREAERIVEDAT